MSQTEVQELLRRHAAVRWTYQADTDIKHNAPACRDWERKQYPKAA